jgi:DNA-binding response OmpR family regulator
MLHILLIEDNPADVLLVREAIRTSSVKADVLIAYDGEQAMRILTELQFQPDFIILDLNLPKFGGLRILERYRAHRGPPVIVFTSSQNPTEKSRALELGAKEYLIKPSDLDTFMKVIREALERWMPHSDPASAGR